MAPSPITACFSSTLTTPARAIAFTCFAVAMAMTLAAAPAAFAVVNGGFETGNMSGWTVAGAGSAQTASIGVTPTEATYQGYLDSTGNFTNTAPVVVASLGVSGPNILALGAGTPTNGTGISQLVTVSAGDILTFDWNFLTDELDEGPTYNDFAFFTIDTAAFLLASRNSSTFNVVSPPAEFDGQTGWDTQTYTFTSAGTYTVGFGVFNVADTGHNSVLLLDAIDIPEPATLGLLTLGAAMWLRPQRLRPSARA